MTGGEGPNVTVVSCWSWGLGWGIQPSLEALGCVRDLTFFPVLLPLAQEMTPKPDGVQLEKSSEEQMAALARRLEEKYVRANEETM